MKPVVLFTVDESPLTFQFGQSVNVAKRHVRVFRAAWVGRLVVRLLTKPAA